MEPDAGGANAPGSWVGGVPVGSGRYPGSSEARAPRVRFDAPGELSGLRLPALSARKRPAVGISHSHGQYCLAEGRTARGSNPAFRRHPIAGALGPLFTSASNGLSWWPLPSTKQFIFLHFMFL